MGNHTGTKCRRKDWGKISPEERNLAHELSQSAKMEMIETGEVKTICPKCRAKARVIIKGFYGESVRIDCDCGFLAEIEKGV